MNRKEPCEGCRYFRKHCEECKHFIPNYELREGRYVPVDFGRCAVRYVSSSDNHEFPYRYGCARWEGREE